MTGHFLIDLGIWILDDDVAAACGNFADDCTGTRRYSKAIVPYGYRTLSVLLQLTSTIRVRVRYSTSFVRGSFVGFPQPYPTDVQYSYSIRLIAYRRPDPGRYECRTVRLLYAHYWRRVQLIAYWSNVLYGTST